MDDEFQEVTNRKHFWWQWVHDSRRNKAQESAAAAAIARATTAQPDSQNRFAVLDQVRALSSSKVCLCSIV